MKKSFCTNEKKIARRKFLQKSSEVRAKLPKQKQKIWNFFQELIFWSPSTWKNDFLTHLLKTLIRIWNYRKFLYFQVSTSQVVHFFTFFPHLVERFWNFLARKAQRWKKTQSTTQILKLSQRTSNKSFPSNEWRIWTAHFVTLT